VLTQAWYDCRYLFDVPPDCFEPPPKVMSGLIQLKRRAQEKLTCDEDLFKRVVKTAFNQRRKTMRNSLKEMVSNKVLLQNDIFNRRPEQLSVAEFEELTNLVSREKS
jgi:16S rRNA (adenine1518-N6/adenine1519-N6)-dimethyltransferase